ncbi:MAG: hypothetical protein EXS05_03505 [Planctomycetaceae bacterium]|nr:hypothetical protein [Planctomycetaceae bacterium]
MLTVTDPASARLAHLLNEKAKDAVVRIIRFKNRLRLRLDHLRPADSTYSHNGRVVLVIGERTSASLASQKLGVRETDSGPRLSLRSN